MNELLEDLERVSLEHEAVKPLLERVKRALDGDKTINLKDLQEDLENYINSDNIASFEGLKEDLENINEHLEAMINPTVVPEALGEPISTITEEPVEDITRPIENIEPVQTEPNIHDTLELYKDPEVIATLDEKIQNGEKITMVVGIVDGIPASRHVLINDKSYNLGDLEQFDNNTLPILYDHLAQARGLDVLTNTDDLKNGRFMASSSTSDTIVVLDLPQATLENIASYAANRQVSPEKQETQNTTKQEEPAKQMVKSNKPSLQNMGFASGLSIGMSIGTAIVLIIVALMYFGVLKPW